MKKFIQTLTIIISLSIAIICVPPPAFATDGADDTTIAKRTIMLYMCGSNLESTSGMATYNLRQILQANFSRNNDVRLIVMTGGAKKWRLNSEYLYDPDNIATHDGDGNMIISKNYNQIWEARGADAADNAGKLELLKAKGITGSEGTQIKSQDELMSDPETLKAFINFCVDYAPAEKYDLILWDHGGGPTGGFAADQHDQRPKTEERMMQLPEIMDAVSNNLVTDSNRDGAVDGKFDFIDFDACLMNTIELNLTLADCMDYYIASPEVEPGYGQDYTEWLNTLGEDPECNAFELGKIIVDCFIDFYENGFGQGQDGTLAVVDTKKLMSSPFINAMCDLTSELHRQSTTKAGDEYLFYDELGSAAGSIEYELEGAYDLGNFAGQLAVTGKDATENLSPAENPYADPAKSILSVLDDQDIIYGKGTSGIRSAEQFFIDQNGKLRYDEQLTSGMYAYSPPVELPEGAVEYCNDMQAAINKLPATEDDGRIAVAAENDGRKALLQQLRQVAADYGLLIASGKAVSVLAAQESVTEIDYNTVREYWMTKNYTTITGNEWDLVISPLFSVIGGETDANRQWMDDLIGQQATEALTENDATAYTVLRSGGTKDLRVELSGTNKRVICGARLDMTADLPAAEEYIKENEDDLGPSRDKILSFPIGVFDAEENVDDLEFSDTTSPERMLEDYLNWYRSGKSTWDFASVEEKWYVVRDAAGGFHAAGVDPDENSISVPIKYSEEPDESAVSKNAKLIFSRSGNSYRLTEISFDEYGTWRSIAASELKETLYDVTTVKVVPVLGTICESVPISKSAFEIEPGDPDKIKLDYVSVNQIEDIGDDGLKRTYTVKDIYNNTIDITNKAEKPAGELVSIEQAKIRSAVYDGSAKEPIFTCNGDDLANGTDYTLYKLGGKNKFVNPGDYYVTLHGKGRFCGVDTFKFTIKKAANPLKMKGRTATVKYKKLKKKAQILGVNKVIKFTKKGQGTKKYTLSSAKKGKKSFRKYFKVNAKTGKVTIKKKLRKGTYKVTVKVKAAGNSKYYSSGWKKEVFRVKVK